MSTKRIPRHAAPKLRISDKAIDAFRRLRDAGERCTCPPRDWDKYWEGEQCAGCESWWSAHNDLHDELRLPPWRWPAVADPEAINPYPDGSTAASQWRQDAEAVAMWRELEAASIQ